jgi:hypothetical protein
MAVLLCGGPAARNGRDHRSTSAECGTWACARGRAGFRSGPGLALLARNKIHETASKEADDADFDRDIDPEGDRVLDRVGDREGDRVRRRG